MRIINFNSEEYDDKIDKVKAICSNVFKIIEQLSTIDFTSSEEIDMLVIALNIVSAAYMKTTGIEKVITANTYHSLLDVYDQESTFLSNITSIADSLKINKDDFTQYLLKTYALLFTTRSEEYKNLQSINSKDKNELVGSDRLTLETDNDLISINTKIVIQKLIK